MWLTRFPCICWIQIVWFWKKEKAKSWWTFLAFFLYVYMGWSKILGMTTLKHESFALTSIGPGQPCREVLYPALISVVESLMEHPNSPAQQTKTARWSKAQKRHLNRYSSNILIGTCAVGQQENWLVVSNRFYVHPDLGKIPMLTNIFQMGWNHKHMTQKFWTTAAGHGISLLKGSKLKLGFNGGAMS